MQNDYTVYKHTAPNNKAYIGVTKQDTGKRWQHGQGYNKNPLFIRAIKKYGWDNITHEILFTGLTKEEAEQKEIELIREYDLTNPLKGYNLRFGGNLAGTMTEAERKAISLRMQGNKNHRYGKPAYNKGIPMSDEQKEKISQARRGKGTGKSNCNYKRQLSEEQLKKMSEIRKGKKDSEETRRKKREYHKLNPPSNCKAVICIDTQKEYISRTEAGRATNTNSESIRKCCNGERLTAGGYKWKWKEGIIK